MKLNKYKKNKKSIIVIILILLAVLFSDGLENLSDKSYALLESVLNDVVENNEELPKTKEVQDMRVHYIDVGQGDSIFIELPNEETILIDAGESSAKEKVSSYIEKYGYDEITYLIGTHPHSDHIGGMKYIVENFNIKNIYMPKATSTSKTYENLLNTIKDKNLKVKTATAGVEIIKTQELKIMFIAPNKDTYDDLNNYSAVVRIEYKDRVFLFMGDAEKESEDEITDDLKADVIKVGHHGSDTSSSLKFANKVKPEYAIISVGEDNDYNHPSKNILNRWTLLGSKVYRTDINGDIIITTDGYELNIETTK